MTSSTHGHPSQGRRNASVRMKMGAHNKGKSVSRRGKATNRSRHARSSRGFGRGPGRPRNSSYRRGFVRSSVATRKGGYGRGRSVGRPRKNASPRNRRGRARSRGGTSGSSGGGPVIFRARRGLYKSKQHRNRRPRRPSASNSSNIGPWAANVSDNYNSEGEGEDSEEVEKPTTSVWSTYTCVVS